MLEGGLVLENMLLYFDHQNLKIFRLQIGVFGYLESKLLTKITIFTAIYRINNEYLG